MRAQLQNFTLTLSSVLLVGACTGYVLPDDGPRPQPTPKAITARVGAMDVAGQAPVEATHVDWSAHVGTWCGPAEAQTLWLTLAPPQGQCADSSNKVYSSGALDVNTGVVAQLDPQALATLPATLTGSARYCDSNAACQDVQLELAIESYTPGSSIVGNWSFTPAGQAPIQGALGQGEQGQWCNFDQMLPAHPAADRLARNIRLREISVYQGVKVPIAHAVTPVTPRNADLVQQREALVRVFVDPQPGFAPRQLSARVTLQDPGVPPRYFEQVLDIQGASSETDPQSTFNIELPKDAFGPATQLAVELRETSRCVALEGTATDARFPAEGFMTVGARQTGPIKVMLVPVVYQADGSGRVPDLSPPVLEQMRERMYAMYPTSDVQLSVRAPVSTSCGDLSEMLDQMRELRASDAPPSDLGYYGLVLPKPTFAEYCEGTCTTGIAGFGAINGTSTAGMGVAFPETIAGTFVHEMGHVYRRPHAPCGAVGGPDKNYPYPNAGLGTWGYDLRTRELFDPGTHSDFMSYCAPDWISDYSFQGILERIVVVNDLAGAPRVKALGPASHYRTLRVDPLGNASWGLDLAAHAAPAGDPVELTAVDEKGQPAAQLKAFYETTGEGELDYFVPTDNADVYGVRLPSGRVVAFAGAARYSPFAR